MQAYQGLPILTNQPSRPTRLVGIWPLHHEGSVGEYQRLAHAAIDEILAAGRTPVVAGGTGLYLRAALSEMELPPTPSPGVRERWGALYDEAGPTVAHATLAERDPAAAAAVHPNDRRRVVRALELAEAGGSLDSRSQIVSGRPTRANRPSCSASTCRPTRSTLGSRSARGRWSSEGPEARPPARSSGRSPPRRARSSASRSLPPFRPTRRLRR